MVALNYLYANFSYLHVMFQVQILEGCLASNSSYHQELLCPVPAQYNTTAV